MASKAKLHQNIRHFTRRLNSAPSSIAAAVTHLNSSPPEPTIITDHLSPPPPPPTTTPNQDDSSIINLNDVSRLFQSLPTTKLIRSSVNLHMAAIDPMVDIGMWVMKSKLMEIPVARDIIIGVIKQTFFKQFCAGESPTEAAKRIEKVWNETGLRGMMNYGVEHTDDKMVCDRNLDGFLQTVDSAKSVPPSSVSFVIVKITAICPMGLLKRVSDLLRWQHKDSSIHLPWKLNTFPIFSDSSPLYHTLKKPDPLNPEEQNELQLSLERLHKICQSCLEANIPVAIDAEDTIVQPAIDYFTYSSAITHNKKGDSPIIFGTIQAYLKDARERLFLVSKAAEKMEVPMGFKLVRGAYMSSEQVLASSLGFESPVHNCIQDTHDCYNDCAAFMLDNISNSGWGSVVLATHNVESGKLAARKARDLGIGSENKRVQFAQLYGMAEALSFGLKNAGFSVSKYMSFGPVDIIIPYLLRRAEENKGILSSSALDRQLMRKELKRRLRASFL